jgi:hypothetical protein
MTRKYSIPGIAKVRYWPNDRIAVQNREPSGAALEPSLDRKIVLFSNRGFLRTYMEKRTIS